MEYLRLKDVCDINMGQSPTSDSYNDAGDGVPFFQGNADFGDRYPITRKWCNAPTKMAQPGDILISVRAPIGAINYAKEECCIGRGLAAVTPDRDKVSPDFVFWFLKGKKEELNSKGTGSTFKAISRKVLEEILVPNVDLKEQSKYAEILEKIYFVQKSQKQELKYLDDLIKARFVEMFGDPQINPFGWDVVNISEVVGGKISNGFFAKRDDYIDDGNVSVLGVANIVNRMYSKVDELPKTNADDKDIEKFEVRYGDMLFCRSSLVAEGIGKASIIPENVQDNILFECHVIRLPLDLSKCVPEFMQTLSTMDFFRNQVVAQSKTATMTTIGQEGILRTDIILPPIDKQREFYDFVRQTDKSKVAVQKALDETQMLFDSLMQEYFG